MELDLNRAPGSISLERLVDQADASTATLAANAAAFALIAAIPTEDQLDGVTVWNDGGVLKVSTT